MREIELIEKRKSREKHFLQQDGTIIAKMYNEDIHYLKDGKYEEIDNSFVEKDDCFVNKSNKYKVSFKKKVKDGLMNLEIDNHYLNFYLRDGKQNKNAKLKNKSKFMGRIEFADIVEDVNLDYEITNSRIKESIILKKKKDIEQIVFDVDTDLTLEINDDNKIIACDKSIKKFVIDAPYMFDSSDKVNTNIFYELVEVIDEHKKYELILKLDKEWLCAKDTKYPVIIDPTIIVNDTTGVYDTYIYPGDTNVDRNSHDILKVGVERVNGNDTVNRALIKFDLPTIGTGSQVIDASFNLFAYPGYTLLTNYNMRHINVHQVTAEWTETNAKWSNMNDKFDSRIINWLYGYRNPISNNEVSPETVNITEIVKKWYANTPNNGLMLKDNIEEYSNEEVAAFYSKNNSYDADNNPKPFLVIHYRNQNGLESYMNYSQMDFTGGSHYINQYNGNLVTCFNVGNTTFGKLPVSLNLFYNTNDVVLNNNIGYGIGYRLSLHQTIKEVTIDEQEYLEYVDEDGTIHYFAPTKTILNYETLEEEMLNEDNTYYDEDGLDMTIVKYSGYYILKDKIGNSMKFGISNNVGKLSEISDVNENKITISYNTSGLISKIVDANSQEINLTYETNKISIISSAQTVVLNYSNNRITTIVTYLGSIQFTYNTKGCVSTILDVSGKKLSYEYYEQIPYRIKKVIEYGLNNTQGGSIEYKYSFNATTVIDNRGLANTYVFNNYGTVKSISNLKAEEDVNDAYGTDITYGEIFQEKNKLSSVQLPIKYVKNYILDSSFENSTNDFVSSNGMSANVTSDYARTGSKSLKLVNSMPSNIMKTINVSNEKYYTFSAYFKSNAPATLELSYFDDGGTWEIAENMIGISDDFVRYDATIYCPKNSACEEGNIKINIICEESAIMYIDDIQLEEGEVANEYNMVDNSDFSDGLNGYSVYAYDTTTGEDVDNAFEVTTLSNGKNAMKIKMNPQYSTGWFKELDVSGKAGDVYNVSFWYKNKGVESESMDGMGEKTNHVIISYNYIDDSEGEQAFPSNPLPVNEKEWQFFSWSFVAQKDFSSMEISAWQSNNANEMYITNLSLYKDVRFTHYSYDKFGNIIDSSYLDNEINTYKYDENNQLIKMLNPGGKNFEFEYDNIVSNRLLRGISSTGINNEIMYDKFGNPIITRIINRSQDNIIENGIYTIRLKGTNKYLKLNGLYVNLVDDNHGHNKWLIEKVGEYYRIRHYIINDKYLTNSSNNLILTKYHDSNSLFELIKNDNGSYSFKSKINNNYINNNNNLIVLSQLVEENFNFEFYLENEHDLFIENNAEYSEDGRFIKSLTDSNLNKVIYDYDLETGVVKSLTDSCGNSVEYNYNSKKQISKVKNGEKEINYNYNSNNLLSKITQGEREYNFIYDEFNNNNQVKIGENIILITNEYENQNGKLLSTIYGNNQRIDYEYDEFDRLNKLIKMDNTYHYKYDNKGNVAKIVDNETLTRYYYDLANRINRYKHDFFDVNYVYDNDGNIICKEYKYKDKYNLSIVNTYNLDDLITKTVINEDEINYNYDCLGRLINRNINNNFNIEYTYVTNGYRTSRLVESMKIDNDVYFYKYDKSNNITHVILNNELINYYMYDNYNQLICENNYITKETIRYKYDNYGNILFKNVYEIDTYNLLKKNTYEYNNSNWGDQLTNFENDTIIYDTMGNPLTIGNITLNWKNGKELCSYDDGINIINYEYNFDGIRTKKIINDHETKYYLEGNRIILEKNEQKMIQYKYNDVDELIGFRYYPNQEIENVYDDYYYVKNLQGDIIGLLDNNYNYIAKYQYDSWGNIISITDENNNDISANVSHIANINPFRYKSYYYDKETKLYYLNNRYYNPQWGRFLNADSTVNDDMLGCNLYAYCGNNPIVRVDSNGKFWWNVACTVIGGIVGGVTKVVSNKLEGKEWNDGLLGAVVGGAIGGLVASTTGSLLASSVSGAIAESITNEVSSYVPSKSKPKKEVSIKNINKSIDKMKKEIVVNTAVSIATGFVADKVVPINKGWIKPQKFISSFTGKYSQILFKQSCFQSTLSIIDKISMKANEIQKDVSLWYNYKIRNSIFDYFYIL